MPTVAVHIFTQGWSVAAVWNMCSGSISLGADNAASTVPFIVCESCAFQALDILAHLCPSKSESLLGIYCVILQWNNYDTLLQLIKLFMIMGL
jgi:hypothetical protein